MKDKREPSDVHLTTRPGEPQPLPRYEVAFEAGTTGRVFIDGRLVYDGPGRLFILTRVPKSAEGASNG